MLLILPSLQLFIANLCIATNNFVYNVTGQLEKNSNINFFESFMLSENPLRRFKKPYRKPITVFHFVHYYISSLSLAFEIQNKAFIRAGLSPHVKPSQL